MAGLGLCQSTGFPVKVGISKGFMVGGFCSSAAVVVDARMKSKAVLSFIDTTQKRIDLTHSAPLDQWAGDFTF